MRKILKLKNVGVTNEKILKLQERDNPWVMVLQWVGGT